MGDKLPKLTAKEAESLLLQNGFVVDRQNEVSLKGAVIESTKKILNEWFCHTIAGKHYTQKSSKNYLRFWRDKI